MGVDRSPPPAWLSPPRLGRPVEGRTWKIQLARDRAGQGLTSQRVRGATSGPPLLASPVRLHMKLGLSIGTAGPETGAAGGWEADSGARPRGDCSSGLAGCAAPGKSRELPGPLFPHLSWTPKPPSWGIVRLDHM